MPAFFVPKMPKREGRVRASESLFFEKRLCGRKGRKNRKARRAPEAGRIGHSVCAERKIVGAEFISSANLQPSNSVKQVAGTKLFFHERLTISENDAIILLYYYSNTKRR